MPSFMSSRKDNILITGKYKVVRRIGGGSFGDIYLAINVANGEVNKSYYNIICKNEGAHRCHASLGTVYNVL